MPGRRLSRLAWWSALAVRRAGRAPHGRHCPPGRWRRLRAPQLRLPPELGSVDSDARRGGSPFGVAVTPDGGYGLAAVPGGGTGSSVIDVLRMAKTASGWPVLVRSIPVAGQPLAETITPDGKYLLVADGSGAVVISVARAESGAASAVLGMLAAPSGTGQGALSASAIEVATSRDGRYAFVTLEYDERAAVFNLAGAVSRGFDGADYASSIPLGQAAVGLAVSQTAAGCTRRARSQPRLSIRWASGRG